MSERYGTIGEMPEMLSDLEDYIEVQITEAENELKVAPEGAINVQDPRYNAGRIQAFRDVLDFIIANPGG